MATAASLFQLGMDLGCAPRKAQAEGVHDNGQGSTSPWPAPVWSRDWIGDGSQPDHFVVRNGRCFAGTHLIIDLWGAERLDDLEHIRRTLIEAVEAAGATLLHIHLHHFTPNGGVSGVAVLAESHISIHTWPERRYAALDVFMCGDAEPAKCVPVLERAFSPRDVKVGSFYRGEVA